MSRLLDFIFGNRSSLQYELVEHPVDENNSRQGIRLLDSKFNGIVVTIAPKVDVRIDPETDALRVKFDFTIESNPSRIDYVWSDLRDHVGDVIVDIMKKDYR